jgi:hypothetical protein
MASLGIAIIFTVTLVWLIPLQHDTVDLLCA